MSSSIAARFFRSLGNLAAEAKARCDAVTLRWLDFDGLVIEVRFLGPDVMRVVMPALCHVEVTSPTRPPDFKLTCWDCHALGVPFPKAPVGIDEFWPRGDVRALSGHGYDTTFDASGRVISMMDTEASEAIYCVGDTRAIPRWDYAEPIRPLLSWFMREGRRQLLHAAAVGRPDGGVLMIGRSGAGKSNTALGCIGTELKFASDDFCAVSYDGTPHVYSLYCTGKTRQSDWARLPGLARLAPHRDPEGRDKVLYYLNDAVPDHLIPSFPLRAVLMLNQTGGRVSFDRVPAGTLVREAVSDTARMLPGAGREVLASMSAISRAVPCYRFNIGLDQTEIVEAILALLDSGGEVAQSGTTKNAPVGAKSA